MGITEVLTFEVNDLASGQIGNIASMTRRAMESIGQATVKAALAAATADRAERRLYESMKLRSGITRDAFNSLKSFNQGLERKLGLDADNLAQIQGTLSLQGVANSKMQEATEFTIGLAEVTGSLESASRLVARSYEGNYTGLKKYLPQVHDAATAHEELAKLFKVAESNADDLVTGLNKLTIAWGNAEEAIGRTSLVQDTVAGGTQILTDVLDVFTAKVEAGRNPIVSAATAVAQFGQESGITAGLLGLMGNRATLFANFLQDHLTPSLQDEAQALRDTAEASRSAKEALEAQLRIQDQLKQAGGFADFEEGETITSDPDKVKRDAARRAKQRREERDRKTRELEDFGAPKVSSELTGSYDLGELGGSGVGDFSGKSFVDYYDEQEKAKATAAKKAEKAQDKARREAIRKHKDAVEEMKAANQDLMNSAIQSSGAVTQAFIDIGTAAATGEISATDAFRSLAGVVVSTSSQIIQSIVSQAAAKKTAAVTQVGASAAVAGGAQAEKAAEELPWPAGIAVIPVVISTVLSLFTALLTGFNKGGLVRGGTQGKDSVPALLTPGEFVLTKDVVDDIRGGRGPRKPRSDPGVVHYANGGMVHAGGRFGGNTTIVLSPQIQQLTPQSPSDFRKTLVESVVPAMRDLAQEGITLRPSRVLGRTT